MKENLPLFGRLSACPWPRLLFQLWQKRLSGYLELRQSREKFPFWFSHGNLLIMANSLPLASLNPVSGAEREINSERLELAIAEAREKGLPVLRSLIETGQINPEKALNWYIQTWKEWFFGFFDLAEGEYSFEPLSPDEASIYAELFTPEIILEGLRRMKNFDLMVSYLPAEKESFQVSLSPSLGLLSLSATEKYLLRLISAGNTLAEIYEHCHLGRQECQRALFAFLTMDIITPVSNFSSARSSETPTWKQLDKILASFNEKCAFIFRFISKEIGPVAWHVLQKSIEDIKPCLHPILAQISLQEDGRMQLPPMEKLAWLFLQKNFRQALIRDLNEILMTEILAVKRTLGSAFEASLVESLEKIGEG
jgi:hypothetical protein